MSWILTAAVCLSPALPFGHLLGGWQTGGPVSPDGKAEVECYLPVDLRVRNTGGKDGAGLCVFTSLMFAARYQNEGRLWDFQDRMKKEAGGGWPEKVDRMILKYGPGTKYLHYVGPDPSVIKLALKTGRMPATTWNGNHMVNTIGWRAGWVAVLDNNAIGEREIRWLKEPDYLTLYRRGGQAWTCVLLAPAPSPPPTHRLPVEGDELPEDTYTVQHVEHVEGDQVELPDRLRWQPGLDRDRLDESPPGYYLNGELVSRERAFRELEDGPRLLDDSGMPVLTVIGSGPSRKQFAADLAAVPELARLSEGFRVQYYTPENWAVARFGFACTGDPCVYVQEPDGFVLHRHEGLIAPDELAVRLSKALEVFAMRKKDPSYDPTRDVDLGRFIVRRAIPDWLYWLVGLLCCFGTVLPLAGLCTIGVYRVWRRPAAVSPSPAPRTPQKRKAKQ